MASPRKIMNPTEMNAFSEKIGDMLKGLPVQHALDVLRITEKNLLWNCTVSKPEDDHVKANQMDIEDMLKAYKKPIQRVAEVA